MSPQFFHLLEQIHQSLPKKKLAWQSAKTEDDCEGAFRVALGEGVIRIEAECEDDFQYRSRYRALLYTREEQLVDEVRAAQYESEFHSVLKEIFQSARSAAFNLDQMIDGMQEDLETGRVRDLPPEKPSIMEIPY